MARQVGLELALSQCFRGFVKLETTGVGRDLRQNETVSKKGI